MKNYKASIIVPVSDNSNILEYFLFCLEKTLDINSYQFIFIIDGPVDQNIIEALEIFSAKYSSITYTQLPQKTSYAYVNNYGRRLASSEFLVFMNTDIFMVNNCIETMINSLRKNQVHAVQPLLLYPQDCTVQSTGHIFGDCFNQHALKGRMPTESIIKQSAYRQALSLALCLITSKVFDDVKGFNEYYYNGWEGLDLTLKITQKGYRCWYDSEAIAYHVEGGSRKILKLNENQQAAYFWSQWGKIVRPDIIDLLEFQFQDINNSIPYVIYNFTTNRGWPSIINKLPIIYNDIINKVEYSNELDLDFFHVLSHQALVYPGPLLFLVKSFKSLSNNNLWLKYRKFETDIFIDQSGNCGTIKSIACDL